MRASSAVVLQGDGLGVAKLGDDAEMTISKLTTALGPISSDTGWKPIGPNSTFQACPGVEARYVDWGGLSVFFNSEDETATQGLGRRFTAWQLVETDTVTEAQLRTEKEIGINSTVDELKVAFGNRVVIKTDDDILGPSYVVYSTANPADNFGIPEFSGSLDALGKYVTQIGAGQGCGE